MTDKLHTLSTQIVTPSQTTALSPKSVPPPPNHDPAPGPEDLQEEEPYTIKCICGFTDDDGLTIYCETCDTWQHIECFYPHNIQEAKSDEFTHSCADCKPRHLDRQRAIERQNLRRSGSGVHTVPERKPKRPPSKSHKKKVKPNDLQLNGTSGSDSHSKHDHPHTHGHKKSKSTHRPSHSISSQPAKRSPSYGQKNGIPNGHPPSPATTPPDVPADFEIHNYSSGFLSLYNDDRDIEIVSNNSFINLTISNVISWWLRDHEKLRNDVGCEFDDVFQKLPPNIDEVKRTPKVEHKKHLIAPDTVLHWQYLTTPQAIEKDVPLVELNGQIGIQKDYCEEPENRWPELSSPLPFVFFHPMLPLYIDTRKEGSLARYVRRSCKPNAVLDTYLSEGSEYHFWLVSDRRIAPNEQITIPWDFRLPKQERTRMLRLIGLGDDETNGQPDFDPNDLDVYQSIATWLFQILSEYGGCACDLGPDCAFMRFHRTYISRSQRANPIKKKSRKPKANAISPTSTGHATNSRAASEGHCDDGIENDSGSSRSKPPSRDMSPAPRQGSFDTLGILTEPTDRDKRKVAMVEDSFRRMEQQQPPRKKKRNSDGTVSSVTSKTKQRTSLSQTPGLPNGTSERRYVNAATNRSTSGSPSSNASPNMAHSSLKHRSFRQGSMPIPARHPSEGPRPEYCDASVQTDSVNGAWFSPGPQSPKTKRRVVSLTKRLLQNRYRLRADDEERRRALTGSPVSVTSALVKMDLDSPTAEQRIEATSPSASKENRPPSAGSGAGGDMIMADIGPHSPTDVKAPPTPVTITNGTYPVKIRSPELRVQMPPVPGFNSANSMGGPGSTPLSSAGIMVQSPFSTGNLPSPFGSGVVNGTGAHPSPVKKKLSLSDYTKSRMNKVAAAKPVGASLKPPSISEEAKSPTSTDIIMSDSPTAEKVEP